MLLGRGTIEKGPDTTKEERRVNVTAERFCVFGSNEADIPYDEQECGRATGVESPLASISFAQLG